MVNLDTGVASSEASGSATAAPATQEAAPAKPEKYDIPLPKLYEPKRPSDIVKQLSDLPPPKDFSRPKSDYSKLNDMTECSDFVHCRTKSKPSNPVTDKANLIVHTLPLFSRFLDAKSVSSLGTAFKIIPSRNNDTEDDAERAELTYLASLCRDTPLILPHDPIPHRIRGPGKDSPLISVSHDIPSPPLMFHFAWDFLSSADRVQVVKMIPGTMKPYARLRRRAASRPLFQLRQSRPPVEQINSLCKRRAELMACALMRFNFVYSDFIRWLGGEYTNDYRDWTSVCQLAESIQHIPIPPDQPPIDFERAMHVSVNGAPIAGHFECKFEDVAERQQYDNHSSLANQMEAVRAKFAKEEKRSYQIAFPRFIWVFIFGLFIAPLTFVLRRPGEEGRICPDPSNTIRPGDTGAANSNIPDAGTEGEEDRNPAVYYGTALQRLLEWIWNLRIAAPGRDILGHINDISAAYHRILYHPMVGVVFAQVFMEFLMVPCGAIFGGKDSSSFYMLPGELRARLASVGNFGTATTSLADNIKIPPPLTLKEQSKLAQATPDAIHQGDRHLHMPFLQASFVDDTATAAWAENIRQAINQSVLAAFVIFGFPAENRRPPPLNEAKWEWCAEYIFKYIGYLIDTRRMLLIWPLEKRQQLAEWLSKHWLDPKIRFFSPLEASRLLGLLRHGAAICPLGIYLSLRIQYIVNDYLSNHRFASWQAMRGWWTWHRFPILPEIVAELRALYRTLDDNIHHPTWCRPIGLLIRREANLIGKSDASYEGLGGLVSRFNLMWRLSADDLRKLGWILYGDENELKQPLQERPFEGYSLTREGMHINLLEFVAIIINIWCTIKRIRQLIKDGSAEHFIARFLADNTSAVSWLKYAGRSNKLPVRNLARLLTALLISQSNLPLQVAAEYLKGDLNVQADALSRFLKHRSWALLIADKSLNLQGVQAYRLPPQLLTILWSVASSPRIADTSEQVIQKLWRLELKPLPSGWEQWDSTTSLCDL